MGEAKRRSTPAERKELACAKKGRWAGAAYLYRQARQGGAGWFSASVSALVGLVQGERGAAK
ncbi:MAG: hypothetical protein HY849_06420 [Nitrosomonadales bacterium]|nr:hypothetical protein [Nitrosomonadales bacterium]